MISEKEILKQALEADRKLSKNYRKSIKNPSKLCDWCMNQFTHQTAEGLMLCDLCNEEYCEQTKANLG